MSLYWIDRPGPGRIAIMARPRAGDWLADEVAGWRANGVDIVVSLLEPDEVCELDLKDEPAMCAMERIDFQTFPIPDRGTPSTAEAKQLAQRLAARIDDGCSIAIHCRAGIGRSSVIAALVLIVLGDPPAEVFGRISAARRLQVPDTEAQQAWVLSVADEFAQARHGQLK